MAQRLVHLDRARRAVETEDVDAQRDCSDVMAAPISVPGSMRPVSSMVTWAWIGTTRPWRTMARWQAAIAALPESRS